MSLRAMSKYFVISVMAVVLLSGVCTAMAEQANGKDPRKAVVRISPADAHEAVASGRALLVCAYPDVEVCEKVMLKDAITLKEFEARLPELKKDHEIIFYCA